jgi:hypothetical protein
MIFSMDVRRARKGDCLLLHFGTKSKPGLVMIDGGPKNVYTPHLKPRIEQIRAARKLKKQDSLIVDLMMVSHVDDDHIQGILELTGQEIDLKKKKQPRVLNVQSFWHNSFDEIIGHEPKELLASVGGLASVGAGGDLSDDDQIEVLQNSDEDDEEVVESGLKVLASIDQGFRLRQNAEGLDYPRNSEFDGKLVIARQGGKGISVADGLKFTVVGPMQPEIEALFKKHQEWLKDLEKKGKSPPEALAAYVDKSVPNLSSIVVLADAAGKRMLLTGDARGDKVLEGLQLVGLLGPGDQSKIDVDLLKVPHHGSANNLDKDFFERIIAKHYVFSGNGEHGNPERESLQMLLDARGDEDYEVHLTYPIDEIDPERKVDWEKERNKQIARKKKKPNTKVREKWSPKKHSLKAFLDENSDFAEKLRFVDEDKAHVIDLADPLRQAWPELG